MTSPNPYQPPAAPGYGPQPYPGYGTWQPPPRLFTANAIGLAAFLGTPFAASLLYATNLRRVGKAQAAMIAVAAGLGATAVVFALAFALPDSMTSAMTMVNLGLVAGARALAHKEFGQALYSAEQQGVRPTSTWWAALVSLGLLIPLAVVVIGVVLASETSVTVAPEQTITFEGDATEAEAQAVGRVLVELGFFGPQNPGEKSATLRKDGKVYTLAFFVTDGAWNEKATKDAFTCVGGKVRGTALGQAPMSVLMLNDFGMEKARLPAPLEGEPAYAAACGAP